MTLHEVMAARIGRGEFPGIVTLVARGDDVRVDTIGSTAFEGGSPMRRDTLFRIASMTKPVLAAVTMMLVEDDVIDLEEPVHTVLPELAGQRVLARPDGPLDETVPLERPVTVEDLLSFRMGAGMPSSPLLDAAGDDLALAQPMPPTRLDPDEWIRRFGLLPLMHQPGTVWQYNTGSLVLGVLVARAAGKPLGDVLRERLFEPLGMRDTGFFSDRELPATSSEEPGVVDWTRPPVFPSGAGGLLCTADDFHAFARMLLRRGVHGGTRLLSEKSVELMTTNRLTPEQIASGGELLDGYGWGLGMAVRLPSGQYGWSGGYGTMWFNDTDEDLVAIGLTQVSAVLWNGTLTDFQRLAYA
ncbi:serine hydrolase domain-containing protein [Actinoplanes sp. NPDC051494]|uniref:serine hydrolase domain-containing protein n=1 Tax=Actinoplanes sp. NPDC051494 TaxID=3363907 RepID=UPI0037B57B9B